MADPGSTTAPGTGPRADGAVDASEPLRGLVRLAVDLRLVLLLLAAGVALARGADRATLALLLLACYGGVGLLLWWDRLARVLLRHPAVFLLDVVLTGVLVWRTGVDGPFALYTISTASLAGVLYGPVGGAVFGAALATAHLGAAVAAGLTGFADVLGLPALTLLAGLGAAAVRRLVLRGAAVEAALGEAELRTAAAEERARLAREMHDTVGKTLHGIALSASTLPRWIERRPEEAGARARELAAAAEVAANEARQLISDLRSDRLDQPLHATTSRWAREWADAAGIELSLAITPVGEVSPSARYELFTILRESLRNVAAHAEADRVSVYLAQDGPDVVLEVADDGRGLACTDLEQLAADGHYGLVGMQERARRAGGRVAIRSRGRGTTIRAVVPRTSAHDMVRDLAPDSPTAAGPTAADTPEGVAS